MRQARPAAADFGHGATVGATPPSNRAVASPPTKEPDMRRLVLLLVAAGLLAVAGCATTGGGPTTSPTPTPPPTLQPMTLVRTGGFAGVHDTLQIDADGGWNISGRSSATSDGQLDGPARARLAEIQADPALPAEIAGLPRHGCCDQFNYDLRIGAQSYSFEGWGDYGPLMAELFDLIQEQTDF
jgi:hypothetical protein